ncbi:MAG: hypothetical protein ACXQTS_02080 [Candidatus Methanospirareceae archaeon]
MASASKRGKKGDKIVIGVVALAILLSIFSLVASASLIDRTFTPTGGNITYAGSYEDAPEDEKTILNVYSGEKIRFLHSKKGSRDVTVSGPYNKEGEPGYYEEPCIYYEVGAGEEWDSEGKPTKGYFKVEDANGEGGWFRIVEHEIEAELKKEKVREGQNFTFRLKKNERKRGVMKLTVEDDEGFSIEDIKGNDIYKCLVRYEERDFVPYYEDKPVITHDNKSIEGISIESKEGQRVLNFDTSKLDMKEGRYKIIIEDYATGAEVEEEVEVERIYLEVDCDEEVVRGKDIVIKIRSSFYEERVNVSVGDFYNETLTLDEEGKKKVKIPTENVDFGTYKVTVGVCGMKETRYVTVKRGEVDIEEVPENATIGDIVHIEGTAEFGDFAVFLIDDIFKGRTRISDDEFEWDWATTGEYEGYHTIEVFILSKDEYASFSANFSIGERVDEEWQRASGTDASAGIFLLLPKFSMEAPKEVAEGDNVVISGEATGADHIYIIIMNYKGEVVFPAGGIAKATPVDGYKWEESIEELDSGRYAVIALHEGKDGRTDAIKNKKWVVGGEGRTLEQRIEILEDAITRAGSDDLFEKAFFTVSAPKVRLEIPRMVEIGDEMEIRAKTNIKDGERAVIALSQNSSTIKRLLTLVEGGNVSALINTSGLAPGKYNVTVDINGRASDEKEVILVEKKGKEVEGEEIKEGVNESSVVSEAIRHEEEINESQEGKDKGSRKIPMNAWDLLIAFVIVMIFIRILRPHLL